MRAEDLSGNTLIGAVAQMLSESGIDPSPMLNYPEIMISANSPMDEQRIKLNRYWNLQLLKLPVDTVSERYCLVPSGEFVDWLMLFRTKIMPVFIEHGHQ